MFLLSQSRIMFLFLELPTNYVLIQKIISTGILYGIKSCKSIQALPWLWWEGYEKTWLMFILMQKLAVIMLTY